MAGDDVSKSMLSTWHEHDVDRGLHALDRDAVLASESLRALVLESFARPESKPRDLFNACARLGRLLADAGASPSLAVTTIDGACAALKEAGITPSPALVESARASLCEGYFAGVVEAERTSARRAWEFPACAVQVDEETVAIAAGYPDADHEALTDWADRVALAASKKRFKRAVLSGPERGHTELARALEIAGIEVVSSLERRGWQRLAFWKPAR
ncbi:hypothetical protein AKJ09_08384 [Labilithrix luteola]|uniref:Uncharacterized protein n=1 Tax=Labilithrix luteola TaxID=1391654 RepID=A0A0K1Q7E0_9BACT|nr:hypothetical protein [Labilithrix luteola]AKV01721.1 hypothetical protein AKJ09_08384 [Labilithrix luteola]